MFTFIGNLFSGMNLFEAILTGSFVTGIIGSIIYFISKAVIDFVLSVNNIDYVANWIDKQIDYIQKKNNKTGKYLREKLLFLANRIISELKENDGIN